MNMSHSLLFDYYSSLKETGYLLNNSIVQGYREMGGIELSKRKPIAVLIWILFWLSIIAKQTTPELSGLKQQSVASFTNLQIGRSSAGSPHFCCMWYQWGSSKEVEGSASRMDHPKVWEVRLAVILSPGGTLHREAWLHSKVAAFQWGVSQGTGSGSC